MHINTLYFSYMKPLIKIHSVMYHDKCTSKFEFLVNGRGGLYMYLLHAGYKFSVRTRYNARTYCKIFTIFYAVYVSTIIFFL